MPLPNQQIRHGAQGRAASHWKNYTEYIVQSTVLYVFQSHVFYYMYFEVMYCKLPYAATAPTWFAPAPTSWSAMRPSSRRRMRLWLANVRRCCSVSGRMTVSGTWRQRKQGRAGLM